MAPHTTFRIGGPADLFVRARTAEELCEAVGVARERGVPFFLLGRGANIVVGDRGFRGVVIRSDIRTLEFPGDGRVHAGAGLDTFPDLINATVGRGLGGLHHFVGIHLPTIVTGTFRACECFKFTVTFISVARTVWIDYGLIRLNAFVH